MSKTMVTYDDLPNTSLDTLIETLRIFTKQTEPAFDDLNFAEKKPRISKVSNFESIDFLEWNFDKKGKYIDLLGIRFFMQEYRDKLLVPFHIKLDDKASTPEAISKLIELYNPFHIGSIYQDEKDFDKYFEADTTQIYEVGAYYDSSLLALEGKKYRQIRLQLNRVNDDIEAGLIRVEQLPINNLTITQLESMIALVAKWIKAKKAMNAQSKPNVKHASFFLKYLKKMLETNPDSINLFNMLVVTIIYDNVKGNCIGFGISELCNNLVNCNIDTKVDFEYKERYPHLSKLINYYTAKQLIEHLNLDPDKVVHTIGIEDTDIKNSTLLDYKINRVAISHTVNVLGYLRSGKGTCKLKSHKRSIF